MAGAGQPASAFQLQVAMLEAAVQELQGLVDAQGRDRALLQEQVQQYQPDQAQGNR